MMILNDIVPSNALSFSFLGWMLCFVKIFSFFNECRSTSHSVEMVNRMSSGSGAVAVTMRARMSRGAIHIHNVSYQTCHKFEWHL